MPTLVPLSHALDAEVARKFGHDLVAIYVNPETVTMVKPSDDNPRGGIGRPFRERPNAEGGGEFRTGRSAIVIPARG